METDTNRTAAGFGNDPGSSTSTGANVLAAVSLACGIASFFAVGLILGPVAIATGIVAIKRSTDQGRREMAITGLVTGVLGMLVSVVVLSAIAVVIWADSASTEADRASTEADRLSAEALRAITEVDRLSAEAEVAACTLEYETVQTAIAAAKSVDDGTLPQDFLDSTPRYFVIEQLGADWQVIPKGDLPAGCP